MKRQPRTVNETQRTIRVDYEKRQVVLSFKYYCDSLFVDMEVDHPMDYWQAVDFACQLLAAAAAIKPEDIHLEGKTYHPKASRH